jgi:hypothetical protein
MGPNAKSGWAKYARSQYARSAACAIRLISTTCVGYVSNAHAPPFPAIVPRFPAISDLHTPSVAVGWEVCAIGVLISYGLTLGGSAANRRPSASLL